MSLVEWHDLNREASGCLARSFLVFFWYDSTAASKMVWKRAEAAVVGCVGDMMRVATVKELICLLERVGFRGNEDC